MRVLHIGKFYPPFMGGMETFLADLLPALTRQGVENGALVHDHRMEIGEGDHPISDPPAGVAWLRRVPSFRRVMYTPVSPRFPFWLQRALVEFQPDLLHLHLPNPSAFWVMALSAARRLPWMIHWHADVVSSTVDRRLALAYAVYRPFEQRLLALGRGVIATSPPYLDHSPALSPWREKCRVIPLGLDPSRLTIPTPSALAWAGAQWGTARPRIFSVGRLTYYKGYVHLLRAARELKEGRVLIAGGGAEFSSLETLHGELELGNRLTLLGRRNTEEIAALLSTCDLFCLPSIERSEAFGMVLLEAMSFGKPVVACAIPGSGVGWVVRDGVTGLLVPPADPSALARGLETLGGDPVRQAAMGLEGRERFHTHFHIDMIADQTANLYRTSLGP